MISRCGLFFNSLFILYGINRHDMCNDSRVCCTNTTHTCTRTAHTLYASNTEMFTDILFALEYWIWIK